jgi:hypothetical protein
MGGGLEERAATSHTRADLAVFLDDLAGSLATEPDAWENDTLERFLRAWSAWIGDMDGYFANQDRPVPETPSWQLVAQMLLAARVYE